MKRYGGPCGDPYCYRGTEGSGGPGGAMIYKDGPCASADCQWPRWRVKDFADGWIYFSDETAARRHVIETGALIEPVKPRPHYTDNPATPIVDAGAAALAEKRSREKKAA